MGRQTCCDKEGVKKGTWSSEEDLILVDYIKKHGPGSWRTLPKNAGLLRCGKSCRLRWTNYLRPDMKRGPFSPEEEATIIRLQSMLGNKWAAIANQLPGRTDNEVKNFWNTHLKKRLFPATSQSLQVGKSSGSSSEPVKIKGEISPLTRHRVQWENARVEAEARLSMQSSLLHSSPTETFKYDHFLRLWNSSIGESFRNINSTEENTCGSAMSQATSSMKGESYSVVDSVQAMPGKTCISTDSSHGQEDDYKPIPSVMPGSGSMSSNEFSDSSDTALKQLLDFLCDNDMGLTHGHGDSFSNFFDLRCDSNVSFSGTLGASSLQQ